jgi:aspartyl protease family protein
VRLGLFTTSLSICHSDPEEHLALRRSLLWLLLLGLAVTLIVLVMRHQGVIASMTDRELPALVAKIGVLVLAGAAVLSLFRDRFSHALETALLWVLVALLLVLAYTYRFELRDVGDRVMAELAPGQAAGSGRTVELSRGRSGEFQIATKVNGARLAMVLDTGASAVVLTHEAAKAAGLPLEMIRYSVNVETANGRAQAAAVTLDRLAIGGIVERSVPALIAPPGQLKTSLLGMSFLNRLERWEVRGDKLVLRGK